MHGGAARALVALLLLASGACVYSQGGIQDPFAMVDAVVANLNLNQVRRGEEDLVQPGVCVGCRCAPPSTPCCCNPRIQQW